MRLRHTTAIALAASLALHGVLMCAGLWYWGFVSVEFHGLRPPVSRKPLVLPPPDQQFGARGGIGEALADFDAAEALRSPDEAQDQPLLGLAAPGPLRPEAPSSMQLLTALEFAPALPGAPSWLELAEALRETDQPAPLPVAVVPQEPVPSAAPQPPQPRTARETSAATDPGPAAGREVDLFSKEAFADYRAGQAVAREGREHRIRGLRRGLSAFLEQVFVPRPVVIRFRIVVDEEGTPTEVTVEKSSGSQTLDETIRKDLFNSWFDPDPSRTGADVGKPFFFTLRIL